MEIELSLLLKQLAMSGLTALFLAFVVVCLFGVYFLWITEIKPLTKGLRWRIVSRYETKQGDRGTEWDWVDPKTYDGPVGHETQGGGF